MAALARADRDAKSAEISRLVQTFKTELIDGPLAALTSGAVDGDGFVAEVESAENSFARIADQDLLPTQPNTEERIALQGERVVAGAIALNEQNTVGLISRSTLDADAQADINSLRSGSESASKASRGALVMATRAFEADLNAAAQTLVAGASPALRPAQVAATVTTEAIAYLADVYAGLGVAHSKASDDVATAVIKLDNTAAEIGQLSSSNAHAQLEAAITKFDAAVLGQRGIFGSAGATGRAIAATSSNLPAEAATRIRAVSGTATNGLATLTASLTTESRTRGIANELVSFTLDGAFAGTAVTNSSGVATLSGVATSAAGGTDIGGVVASFQGSAGRGPSIGVGDLAVNQNATRLIALSGSASLGGTATLTATLISPVTGQGIAGETIDFLLQGASVGSAVTNASGTATLTGVATTAGAGTNAGYLLASFSGDSTNAPATAIGSLVVTEIDTALGSVSGTASYGGKATLTATLTASATGAGISGQTVSFTLDGTSVGSATTNSSGVATLSNVSNNDNAGTDSGGIVASFTGSTTYPAAANATGNLVVAQAASSLSAVSGTASYGGAATLTATLTSAVTDAGASGQTIDFTLDGKSVGTATTNSSGVATLSGVNTTDAVGTDSNGIVASFAGDTDYGAASNATGSLVVSAGDTVVSPISGTVTYGGSATLTATLTSSISGADIASQTIVFTLNGTGVGSATTNSSGVATLTGVTTTDPAGTYAGVVGASFAATTDYNAATGSGDLVVSQAATTLSAVSGTGTASSGQATLTAKLTSQTTNAGVAGETVTFEIQGTQVGTAVTNSSGVATLSAVATTLATGTYSGAITAIFSGDNNYEAAANAIGDLTIS